MTARRPPQPHSRPRSCARFTRRCSTRSNGGTSTSSATPVRLLEQGGQGPLRRLRHAKCPGKGAAAARRRPRKFVVLGAGYAGLAAALELIRARPRASPSSKAKRSARRAGPQLRRSTKSGEILDNGQHILMGCYHETLGSAAPARRSATGCRSPPALDVPVRQRARLPSTAVRDLPAPFHLLSALLGLSASWGAASDKFFAALRLALRLRSGARAASGRRDRRRPGSALETDAERLISRPLGASLPRRAERAGRHRLGRASSPPSSARAFPRRRRRFG